LAHLHGCAFYLALKLMFATAGRRKSRLDFVADRLFLGLKLVLIWCKT